MRRVGIKQKDRCQLLKLLWLDNYILQHVIFSSVNVSNCYIPVKLNVSFAIRLQDWRTAVDMIKYIEPSLPVISSGCLNQFLHSLGKSGKIETMLKVSQIFSQRYYVTKNINDFPPHWYLLQYPVFLLFYFSCVQLFFKMLASGADVNLNTYSILLKNLLSSGNWRKYLEVRYWSFFKI